MEDTTPQKVEREAARGGLRAALDSVAEDHAQVLVNTIVALVKDPPATLDEEMLFDVMFTANTALQRDTLSALLVEGAQRADEVIHDPQTTTPAPARAVTRSESGDVTLSRE